MADDTPPDAAPAAPSPALAPESQPEAPSAQPAVAPAPDLEARLWAAVCAWRDAHIAGGPIARATECWNHLEAALGRLVASILKEV